MPSGARSFFCMLSQVYSHYQPDSEHLYISNVAKFCQSTEVGNVVRDGLASVSRSRVHYFRRWWTVVVHQQFSELFKSHVCRLCRRLLSSLYGLSQTRTCLWPLASKKCSKHSTCWGHSSTSGSNAIPYSSPVNCRSFNSVASQRALRLTSTHRSPEARLTKLRT